MSKAAFSNEVNEQPQHQVFINFRGEELRCEFISHLVDAMEREGIKYFIDTKTRMGKPLTIFFEQIEKSRIAIAVISSLYTESHWCLDELAKIHECAQRQTLEVFPVFFKVKTKTVKYLKDEFGKNFEKLLEKDDSNREVWRKALEYVTRISGKKVKEDSNQAMVIKKIIEDVKMALKEFSTDQETKNPIREKHTELSKRELELGEHEKSSFSSKAYPLFGIETRLEQLKKKLDLESNKVTRIVGIVGMPGIGKTALAKKLMDDCGHKFYHTMFLDQVREKSGSLALHRLQRDLLEGLKKSQSDENKNIDPDSTIDSLKAEFKESKVLIVLDDVSKASQIQDILGGCEWFKKGSRVVITASSTSAVNGEVDETYLVPGLSDSDALKYFEKFAFSGGSCEPSYMNLARKVVDFSRGNPLALRYLGGEFFNKDEAYWKSRIKTLAKTQLSNPIQNVLRIPYNNLDKNHKDLFLDVACLFSFEDEYLVRSVLDSSPHELRELADKFLINICGGRLEINDLMYTLALGLESASTSDRRLSNHLKINTILKNKAGANKVRGIFLDMSEVNKMSLGSDTFKEMNNLRYLKLYNSSCPRECEADCNLNFPNGLEFALPAIRYLNWLKFPLESFPQGFEPGNLIDLKLPYSQIEQLWIGEKETSKLRWVDLNHSSKLCTLSGLSLARKLESLNLEGCTGLKTIHKELQNMGSLVYLNLRGCTSLKFLSEMNLTSLKKLILSGCSSLEEFKLVSKNLEELHLDGTAIKELPDTIGDLQRLVLLTLKDCKRLLGLPVSIGKLKALQKLVLSGCSELKSFPEITENLEHLKTFLIDRTKIKELPPFLHRFIVNQGQPIPRGEPGQEINRVSSVQRICLRKNNIRSLPDEIGQLDNLKWLDIKYCEMLKSLPMLPPNLHWLDAHGCISLRNIKSPLARIEAATEHPHTTFIFTNCDKLDQVAKNQIVSYVREKIQLMSDPLTHQDKGSTLDVLIGVCYPSWQLPVWFNHRTVGSELTQKLPRHWNEDGLTGIALCVVVSFESYRAESNRVLVRCTGEFKERDESLFQFSCVFGGWTEHGSDRPRGIIKSYGHVFIGYTSLSEVKTHDRGAGCVDTEASFKFQVTDGTKQIANCEVLKCGFTLIYAPNKHIHFQIPVGANSTPLVATRNVTDISDGENSVSSVPVVAVENGNDIPGSANSAPLDAIENGMGIPGGANSVALVAISTEANSPSRKDSVSGSSEEGEGVVINEESPRNGEASEGNGTSSCEKPDDQSLANVVNSICELLDKPIRLILLVMSIYTVSAFVLPKEKKERKSKTEQDSESEINQKQNNISKEW